MRRSTGFLLTLIALASMSAAWSVGNSSQQQTQFHHQGLEGALYRDVLG